MLCLSFKLCREIVTWFIYHFVKLLFQYKHHCTDVEDGLVSDELREKLLTWGPEGKCVRCLESEDKIRQLDSPDCVIKDEIVSDWRHRWSIKVINMYIYTTMYELVWTMVCHTSYIDFCLDRRYLLRWWCNNHQILCFKKKKSPLIRPCRSRLWMHLVFFSLRMLDGSWNCCFWELQ